MRKIVLKLGIFIVLLCSFASIGAYAQNDYNPPLEAYGLNTVAGHSTYLRTSQTLPNSSVVFEVADPLGEITTLNSISNESGIAQVELSNYYTEMAGDYAVSARLENDVAASRVNSFTVHPNEVSDVNSVLSPEDQVIRSYTDEALITVALADDYENPIEGHLVKLISSSDLDDIETYSDSELTDSNGEISFLVSSDDVGTVTYSAYDVTADKILEPRAKIVYFDKGDYVFSNNNLGDYSRLAAIGNSSFGVDGLEFSDVSDSIQVGESVTFTLSAVDVSAQTVTGYEGTVRFSVIGDNSFYANLSDDYTFTAQDLGEHTFSLAMSFQQEGTYVVEARDLDNTAIYGEYDFVVGSDGASAGSGINISNPTPGTYSNNIQVISGLAPAGSQLKIYDNEVEIASLVADATGAFSYTTSVLADGQHNFYVATVNEIGTITGVSETISVNIDVSGPEISNIELEPSDSVDPGAIVNVKLYTDDILSSAAIVFQDNIYEMTHSVDGYYEGSFAAPIEFGDYVVNFVLVDQLGNESKIEGVASINVGGDLSAGVLGNVTDLSAVKADHRVTLTWNAPQILTDKIKNYRVYYGLSPNQLTEAVDTFTASTIWYIPNLKNGVEYYFAVIAVDEKGNISEQFSNIVSATPGLDVVEVLPVEVQIGTAGEEALEEMEEDVSDSGPEIIWLVVFSLMGGIFYSMTMRKRYEVRERL
jgi:hypothetical protein